jgi:sugar-phosphatase
MPLDGTNMADLPIGRSFAAFLFDMDGTLLNSIESANRCWQAWAEGHGLDFAQIKPTMHGMRAIETIRRWAPHLNDEQEYAALTQAEMDDIGGIDAISGAAAFLAALPRDRWALVTSAPRLLALRRLESAGLPEPALLVTADDVAHGKPAPDCFLLAAEKLGFAPQDCLVWEDAAPGIAAAEAAGMAVVVIGATHETPMQTPHPVVPGYDDLAVLVDETVALRLAVRTDRPVSLPR